MMRSLLFAEKYKDSDGFLWGFERLDTIALGSS